MTLYGSTPFRTRRPSVRRACASRRRGWSCFRTSPGLAEDEPFMASEALIELLVDHNSDYWGPGLNFGGGPRKKLNATRLGRMVKQATNTTSRRPGGGGTARGYEREQLDRTWRSMSARELLEGRPCCRDNSVTTGN